MGNLPNAEGDVVPKGELAEETAVCAKDGEEPKLNALVDVPNEGVLEDPKPGALLPTPNAELPEVPKPGVDEPNGVLEAPNKDDVEPNAGVAAVPVAPNASVVVVLNVGVVDAPKVLLPNVGCVCWNVLPKGLDWLGDDPKPPKLCFCPNKDPTMSRAKCEIDIIPSLSI
jgi:hypothetical protein